MKKTLWGRRGLALLLLLAGSVVALPGTSSAQHSWLDKHWSKPGGVLTLKLGDNVSGAWDADLLTASADWSSPAAAGFADAPDILDTSVVTGTAGRNCSYTTGMVEVCSGDYGDNGWLGLASVSVKNGHIVAGRAQVNDWYFNQPTWNYAELRAHVMCQEIGHTFGLGHQDETTADLKTCMDYSRSLDPATMHPNHHDYEQLGSIYAHTTDTTTSTGGPKRTKGASSTSPGQTSGSDRSSWGDLVERHHGHEVYVRNTGRDSYEVTYVTSAEDHSHADHAH